MAHVSKKKLNNAFTQLIFDQLSSIIAKSKKTTAGPLLSELLTKTEQTMLAKRLAVILMLHEGYSSYVIWNTLHMSKSTVLGMKEQFLNGHYSSLLTVVGRNKAEKKEMWGTIEKILRLGLPSMGKERWQSLKH